MPKDKYNELGCKYTKSQKKRTVESCGSFEEECK